MSTITTRAGKGSPLTNTELDANFTNLNTDKLEAGDDLGTPSGVVLTNATGLPTAGLLDNSVTDAKLRDSAALSVIGRAGVGIGDPADIEAGANEQVLRRSADTISFGAIDLGSNQAVTGTLPIDQGGTGAITAAAALANLGITATAAELNYVDGVTSAIQTQIDGKEPADATIVKDADIGSTVQAYDANLTSFVSTFTLPTVDGTSGQALVTDAAGTLSFADASGGVSELATQTKTYTLNEESAISLSESVLTPLVAAVKVTSSPGQSNTDFNVVSGNYTFSAPITYNATDGDLELTGTSSAYTVAISTTSTDTSGWSDITALTATQTLGDGEVYYALSKDDRTTWTILDATNAERDIARNNLGTWQYNSNATYGSETWTNATTNTELGALSEALAPIAGGTDYYSVSGLADDSVAGPLAGASSAISPFWKPDGTTLYALQGTVVVTHNASTAWDVDTFTEGSGKNLSAAIGTNTGTAVHFNPAGTKLYLVMRGTNDRVSQYTLSTAWDLDTIGSLVHFDVGTQETNPRCMAFNNDGTVLYVSGSSSDAVFEYDLSTAYDVSSATYNSVTIDISGQTTNGIYSLIFSSDGTRMVLMDVLNDLYQYSLSTAWDLSTASYDSVTDTTTLDSAVEVVAKDDGSKLYSLSSAGVTDDVKQYSFTGSVAVPTNQMDKTVLDSVTTFTPGDDLDVAIAFRMASGATVPSSDGIAITYSGTLETGAVHGTDYSYTVQPSQVTFKALVAGDYKIRVL